MAVNYYEMKRQVLIKTKDWLKSVDDAAGKGVATPLYRDFLTQLMIDYGCSEKMVIKSIELLVPGGTINEKGEIVKK